jgi:hypothetical protein
MKIFELAVGLIVVVAVVVHATPDAAAKATCSCDDRKDLLNRLAEVDAAIAAYKFQIEGMLAKEKKDGTRLLLSDASYRDMQNRVQQDLRRVTDKTANNNATGETSELFCETEVKAPTKCLEAVVSKHEKVHRDICESTNVVEKGMTEIRLVDAAQQEINAYAVERDYILAMLQDLPCKPKGWFGTVQYQVTSSSSASKTIPPNKSGSTTSGGGSEDQKAETILTGVIHVADSVGTSSEDASVSITRDFQISGTMKCSMKKPPEAVSRHESNKADGADTATGTPKFSVSVTKNEGTVTFETLHHKVKMQVTMSVTSSGCNTVNKPAVSAETTKEAGGEVYKIPGRLSPDGMNFTGQTSAPPIPAATSSSGPSTASLGAQLFASVTLHRLRE